MKLALNQEIHLIQIQEFISFLNRNSQNYILKGGTSLMLCYGLTRFSEDIDLDTKLGNNFFNLVKKYCSINQFEYVIKKDTDTTKRVMLHYDFQGEDKTLKIEVSLRNRNLDDSLIQTKNGIKVYKINPLFNLKLNALSGRNKIRDLFDVCFIYNNYSNELSNESIFNLDNTLSNKGLESLFYMIDEQEDPLINKEKLENDLLTVFDNLGTLDRKTLNEIKKDKLEIEEISNTLHR